MCLAVPGKIISIEGEDLGRTGKVSFSGILKTVSLAYVPESQIGDYVVVHVGFAISKLDIQAAAETLNYLEQISLEQTGLEQTSMKAQAKELEV